MTKWSLRCAHDIYDLKEYEEKRCTNIRGQKGFLDIAAFFS